MLGIFTYGYKIIRVLGVKMVHLSFTRGFAVELGAAIVIVVASRYGLPVSSTQARLASCLHGLISLALSGAAGACARATSGDACLAPAMQHSRDSSPRARRGRAGLSPGV